MSVNVSIDREGCIECGVCMSTCPAVFILVEGEKASIVEQFRTTDLSEGEVGEDLQACAKEAADVCPVSVIRVT